MAERLSREQINFLKEIPLLQSGELKIAPNIKYAENLDPVSLHKMWDFTRHYVDAKGFIAVAATQLYSSTLFDYVGRDDLLRVIYFDDDPSLHPSIQDALIINPLIANISNGSYVNIEGCGSIEESKLRMVMKRPMMVNMKCLVWNYPMDLPVDMEVNLAGLSASTALHEEVHLNGKDATDHLQDILDFAQDGTIWDDCNRTQKTVQSVISQQRYYDDWLVNRDGKLIVVNKRGNFKRNYIKQ